MRYLLAFIIILLPAITQAQTLQTRYVSLITFDGLRWQEVFTGADTTLISDEAYVDEQDALKSRFWAEDPNDRRMRLMPFFWTVLAKEGRLYGNRQYGSHVNVTNNRRFSYG